MTFDYGRAATIGGGTILTLVTLCVTPVYAADIVLDAASGARVGAFAVVNDPAASNGTAVSLPDQGRVKAVTAVAQPADYLELTFTADANTPYHLWVRLRAAGNTYANDSFHVQFTNVGAAAIGTTSSYVVNLEEAGGAGVSGYGWQDNGYGAGVMGPDIVFATGGTQRLRIQNREDGFVIDEVVLSSTTYLRTAPGATKNDTTMLTRPIVAPVHAANVVLDAVNGTRAGAFIVVNDAAASNGTAVTLPNTGRAKVLTALAAPADYLELTFSADANTAYHLWVRMRAAGNTFGNDSVHIQFTNVAAAAIGTTSSYVVNLEDAGGAGLSGYGWQDNGYGVGVMGPHVVFDRGGTQRLRIQNREDGFVIDELVLSATTYLNTAPGGLKNDTATLTSAPSPNVIRVPAGASLQAALNGARPGDTLLLAAGARYVGNFDLPPNDGPEYITITSDANVPAAGTRVAAGLIDNLATIQSPDGWPAVQARIGANYYRFVGVVFRGVEGVASGAETTRDIVAVGDGLETDSALLPSHFVFDRVLIRGDATYGAKRGILGNGHDITVKNSDIRDIFRAGQDTTTFGCFNCGTGYLLQNNWLEAGAEVVMFGGAASPARTVARDIVVEDNVLTRPLAWKALAGPTYSVKNLFELKEGINVVVRRNFMEYNWPPSQPGYAILLTAKDSKKIDNVLFEDNVVKSTAGGMNILGWDYTTALLAPTSNVTVRNNLFVISKQEYGGSGFFLLIGSAPRNIKFDHNTIVHDGTTLVSAYTGSYLTADGVRHTDGTIDGFVWTNNLSLNGAYGFNSYGSMNGLNLLNAFPDITMHDNVIAGYTGRLYPGPNHYPSVSTFWTYFANPGGGDYRVLDIAPIGADGQRVGADVSRLPSRK